MTIFIYFHDHALDCFGLAHHEVFQNWSWVVSRHIDECCIDDDNGDVESTNLQNALIPQLSHVHLFMQALLDLAIELWF